MLGVTLRGRAVWLLWDPAAWLPSKLLADEGWRAEKWNVKARRPTKPPPRQLEVDFMALCWLSRRACLQLNFPFGVDSIEQCRLNNREEAGRAGGGPIRGPGGRAGSKGARASQSSMDGSSQTLLMTVSGAQLGIRAYSRWMNFDGHNVQALRSGPLPHDTRLG
eukprot:1160346-Pelagomonas_calceolata.AAC.9